MELFYSYFFEQRWYVGTYKVYKYIINFDDFFDFSVSKSLWNFKIYGLKMDVKVKRSWF